jgi:hypothetical protein
MIDESQIVPANHADPLSLTRPDGTGLRAIVDRALAIDEILQWVSRGRLCGEPKIDKWIARSLSVGWLSNDWAATLGDGPRMAMPHGVGDSPWQAVLSLAEKLKENA